MAGVAEQSVENRIHVIFLDQTGSRSVEAYINPSVPVRRILTQVLAKMNLPQFGPDGREIQYSLDHKEGGRRLRADETLPEARVQPGDHLIVYPEMVAGSRATSGTWRARGDG